MTESTITDLLKELIAIREGMKSYFDPLIASASRQERWMAEYRPPDPQPQAATKADLDSLYESISRWIEWFTAEYHRNKAFEPRIDAITGRLLTKIETLEKVSRMDSRRIDQLEIDKADMLHMLKRHESDLDNMAKLLRAAEIGETRTRPDTGASKVPDWFCTKCQFLNFGSETKCKKCGGSGSQPAEPAPDSSGTEQLTSEQSAYAAMLRNEEPDAK